MKAPATLQEAIIYFAKLSADQQVFFTFLRLMPLL